MCESAEMIGFCIACVLLDWEISLTGNVAHHHYKTMGGLTTRRALRGNNLHYE